MPCLLLLLCLLALVAVTLVQLRRGRPPGRAVLLVAPTVPLFALEGVLRAAVESLLEDYSQVAVYCGAQEGERAQILVRTAGIYHLEVLPRAEALRLWRRAEADFWRLCPDGGLKLLK